MEVNKPPCKFGVKCYRKNPKHFDIFSHPGLSERQLEKTGSSRRKTCERRQIVKKPPSKTKKNDSSSFNKLECSVGLTESLESNDFKNFERENVSHENKIVSESQESMSLDFVNDKTNAMKGCSSLKGKPVEEIIKTLFLVNMPPDFYSFYEFYKNVIQSQHLEALQLSKLKLVGPFDVLSGNINYSVDQECFLCHWRFYYDPPEFQTVLVTDSGFHIGYWRDDPEEDPNFLANNDSDKGCDFKIDAENIFGSVYHYLNEFIKSCDPFKKIKISKLQTALSDWANKNSFSLEKKTDKMKERQKNVVSKTFHGIGIVVPVDEKTDVGYRPLVETDGNLKKICNLLLDATDDTEKESLWEKIQLLITAANIANDECDFGNGLELGIDLFCMGSPMFHKTIKHLLCTAYSLLNRTEFEKIVEVHLKFRRKGNDLSVNNWFVK